MKKDLRRRDFIATSFKAGIACCAFTYGTKLQGQDASVRQNAKPDPKSLNYCGYKCTPECLLYKATVENNIELKKKAYEEVKFKEKFKIEFDPEKVFCYGCKVQDKPLSLAVNACTVRKCAIAKKYDCCIQCNELARCDKELWISFPKFKEAVIEMQKKYRA
jgi:hypothetical protein